MLFLYDYVGHVTDRNRTDIMGGAFCQMNTDATIATILTCLTENEKLGGHIQK